MHYRDDFPHAVKELRHIEIPLSDGTRLAARIWLPIGAADTPVRQPREADAGIVFEQPEAAVPHAVEQRGRENHNWHVVYDLAADRHTLIVTDDNGLQYLADAELLLSDATEERYSSVSDGYQSIEAETHTRRMLQRGEWHCVTKTRIRVTADAAYFYLVAELDAWEGATRIFSRNWDERIRRHHV